VPQLRATLLNPALTLRDRRALGHAHASASRDLVEEYLIRCSPEPPLVPKVGVEPT
jgi:hypothetical protein